MTVTKPKPLIDFGSKADANGVLSRGTAVYAGLKDNPDFTNPPPPIDLTAVFKPALDDLSAWIGNAMDGGKKAIAERDHKKAIVAKMLRQLAHYVEANCKDNITIFYRAGSPPLPLSVNRQNRRRKPSAGSHQR